MIWKGCSSVVWCGFLLLKVKLVFLWLIGIFLFVCGSYCSICLGVWCGGCVC